MTGSELPEGSKPLATYIQFTRGPVARTVELSSVVYADYSQDGTLVGVEVLGTPLMVVSDCRSDSPPAP